MANLQNFFMTGCASGIGRHVTDLLTKAGHSVFATDIDIEALGNYAQQQGWPSDRVKIRKLDVRSPEEWEGAFGEAISAFGHIDVSMNVPGVMRAYWIDETPVEDVHLQLDINVKGVIFGTQTAARHMIERREGHIVNIGSLTGVAPVPGMSVYSGSKYAVRGFSLSAGLELRRHGVYVTVVCPDAVDTPLLDIPHIYDEEAALAFAGPRVLAVEEVGREIVNSVLPNKPEIFCIPRSRGRLARFAESFPSLMNLISPLAVKKGRAEQERRKNAAS